MWAINGQTDTIYSIFKNLAIWVWYGFQTMVNTGKGSTWIWMLYIWTRRNSACARLGRGYDQRDIILSGCRRQYSRSIRVHRWMAPCYLVGQGIILNSGNVNLKSIPSGRGIMCGLRSTVYQHSPGSNILTSSSQYHIPFIITNVKATSSAILQRCGSILQSYLKQYLILTIWYIRKLLCLSC